MSVEDREKQPPEASLPSGSPTVRLEARSEGGPISCTGGSPVLLVGGRRDCDLPLSDPDVSKIHCAIINTGRHVLARDLLSRTGTAWNGSAVTLEVLRGQGELSIGPVPVEVSVEGNEGEGEAEEALRLPVPLTFRQGEAEVVVGRNGVLIGRRQMADVVVDHPDVSLVHALVFALSGRPAIFDLGSRSGTCVNGHAVRLAWLSPGDEIEVGGQKLTVHWDQAPGMPEQEPSVEGTLSEPESVPAAPAEEAAAETPVPACQETPGAAPGSGEQASAAGVADLEAAPAALSDLEATIAAVQAQVKAAHQRLEKQAEVLRAREAELRQRLAELEPRESAVQAREAQLAEREQTLSQRLAELEAQQSAVAEERAELERQAEELADREQALAQRLAELEQQQAELDARRSALEAAEHACAAREQALGARAAELDEREEELGRRRAALDQEQAGLRAEVERCAAQAEALQQRERRLAVREEQQARALQKIEQFKEVLQQAGALLATTAPEEEPDDGTGNAPTGAGGLSAGGGVLTGGAGNANQAAAAPAQVEAADDGEEVVDAPLVDKPLFAVPNEIPPRDWPAELRERFRVLRRMSGKSDADLMRQVWAERGRLVERPEAGPPAQEPKKRRLWGG